MGTEALPTVSQFFAMKLASRAKRVSKVKEDSTPASALIQTIVRLMMHLAGFGSLTFAGFTWNMTAGLVIAGISCFAFSWLTTGGDQPATNPRHAPDLRTGR